MKIEFWSDIICPYCGLMDNRLHRARDLFGHDDDLQVIHRSFQVHPDLPREGVTQRRLLEMHGMSVSTAARQVFGPIEASAEAEGLVPYRALERTMGPTDLTHELLAHATEQGRGSEVWTAMFRAHFGAGRQLWTAEDLLDFAADTGLDRAEAAEALRSRRYRDRVRAEQRAAERLGARGAPFLVIDGTYAVPGAVRTEQLLAAMTQAWEEGHPAPEPLPVIGEAEGLCGPDGCEIPHPGTHSS